LPESSLIILYVRMGKYQEAEKQLKKAIELDPKNPDIRLILSKSYELNGQKDLAETLRLLGKKGRGLFIREKLPILLKQQ